MPSSEKWSIWPVNMKPATPLPASEVAYRVAVVNAHRAAGFSSTYIATRFPKSLATYEHVQRARCIGEGLVRARFRRERFIAWLTARGACDRSLVHAARCRSPEHAVATAPKADWLCWLAIELFDAGGGSGCPACSMRFEDAAVRILASPEWAALPWQRDPEVGRG